MGHKTLLCQIFLAFVFLKFKPVRGFKQSFRTKVTHMLRRTDTTASSPLPAAAVATPETGPSSFLHTVRRLPLLSHHVVSRTIELLGEDSESLAADRQRKASIGNYVVYVAVLLAAPPLALAREAALYAGHLARRPVVHARATARCAVNSFKYAQNLLFT